MSQSNSGTEQRLMAEESKLLTIRGLREEALETKFSRLLLSPTCGTLTAQRPDLSGRV